MYDNMTPDIDFSYIKEVFQEEEERISFVCSLKEEIEQAKIQLLKGLDEGDTQLFRKTLHYLGAHLEMLGLFNLKTYLEEVKQALAEQKVQDELDVHTRQVELTFGQLSELLSEHCTQRKLA
jgi:HPt (histidine-containing phosphotransfer) domain-containing protein